MLMRHETTWELRFSELETKAGRKQQADLGLGGCQCICVDKVVLRLLLRRRLQQAGGTELVLRASVDGKPIG